MPRILALLIAARLLVFSAAAGAAPPTDEQLDAAVKSYMENEKAATDTKREIKRAEFIRWADDALTGIDTNALTLAQITRTVSKCEILLACSKRDAISERLGELAKAATADGADAAAIRLHFIAAERDQSTRQTWLTRSLTHPNLQEALKQGRALMLFKSLQFASKELLPDILKLGEIITPDMPTEVVARVHQIIEVAIVLSPDDDPKQFESLRAKFLSMVRETAKQDIKETEIREALARSEKELDGPFLKGTLMNNPAPELEFTWSNTTPPIKSIAELKGRVVVLDFWLNSYSVCTASFPDIKKLQARYEGYQVVILGVTNLKAGSRAAGTAPVEDVDQLARFMKDNDMTWKVAVTERSIFNTDYGVFRIPHMIIIDAKGNVRHRKIHTNSKVNPIDDKIAKIDVLLKEAGAQVPPAYVPESGAKK